jgi:phosphatidylglycerophosphatase A
MRLYKTIASGLGSGYSPVAPGTAGSIVGIVLLYLFNLLLINVGFDKTGICLLNLVAIVLSVFIGVAAIKKVHTIWPHDAPAIVIDEIAGVWITAFMIPLDWKYYLYALVIFRFFDILKPFYIRRLDKMKSDWSVMLDDMLAGLYGLIVLQLLIYFNLI